jgi:lipopolysaccharide/colanic/teichoic acid biosynthesis glycosyltransferase/NDP-sugar pyrophosphorylase family protein
MQAIVLAASGGPEFGPLCQGVSKGLLPFLGEPLLAHVVRYLEGQGASRIRVNLCQQPYPLEKHFELHPPARAGVSFHLEPRAVGTAGAVKRLAANAKETLVVCMGDLITNVDLDAAFAFHKQRNALVTLVLVPGDRGAACGRASTDEAGRLTSFEEGATDPARAVNAGIYLIEPEALVHVPSGNCDFGRDFFPALLEKNLPVYGFHTDAYWMDAGHPAGYYRALADVLHGRVAGVQPLGEEVQPGVWVAAGAKVHPKAKLAAPVWIGAEARVDQEAKLGPAVAVEGPCRVGRGAVIIGGAVFPDTYVGKATRWESQILFPDGLIDLTAAFPRAVPSPAAELLGTTYREPTGDKLHTLFDQVVAGLGLLAIAPLMLLLAVAIKLDSPGPAFYTQLRVGQDRRPYRHGAPRGSIFECYKFRTMHVDADAKVAELMAQNQYKGGAFFKLEHDPRITRVGNFLRKSSLDELPQLFNVLLGEMRLVGNRPLPVYEAEALVEDWQRTRFLAPAGITGLWQISGRSDLSEKERLALDAYYTVTRTFASDLGILFRTLPALLARRGAR